jgi:hypothetical protein
MDSRSDHFSSIEVDYFFHGHLGVFNYLLANIFTDAGSNER